MLLPQAIAGSKGGIMKFFRNVLVASAILAALPGHAQIAAFKHIVVIVQENRTPDNLFRELCHQTTCDPADPSKYDILIDGWKTTKNQTVSPVGVDLGIPWDIEHQHNFDWVNMCDQSGTECLMDGAVNEVCLPNGPPSPDGCTTNNNQPEFTYVQRYTNGADVLGPYISLALTYGWANRMFATNQGPSFPAHQFIYGATSAPSTADDGSGTYAAENAFGCLASPGSFVQLIINGVENEQYQQYPCFQHQTLGTLFGSPKPWRYYTPYTGTEPNLWTAPEAIESECGATNQNGGVNVCPGSEFETNSNVVPDPRQVLVDIQNCHLQNLSWVIPNGRYSDHASLTGDLGPQWVASIVNSIGASPCEDSGQTYWQDTAIIIMWDDWGGWYDHEPPPLNTAKGYQLGFRVPLLVVSAYGANNANGQCNPFIDGTDVLDFGSVADFIEGNFFGGWTPANEGKLNFADARALLRAGTQDLSNFFNLNQPACTFHPVVTRPPYDANYFINDTSTVLPPDDD